MPLAPLRLSGSPASPLRRREKHNSSIPPLPARALAASTECVCRAQVLQERENYLARFVSATPSARARGTSRRCRDTNTQEFAPPAWLGCSSLSPLVRQ